MRKLILLFILLSGFVAVITAAEFKIALIGDSTVAEKAADLALTTLSKEKDIALLERGAIDKLLREHKLTRSGMSAMELVSFAQIAHVDIFAVINSAVKNKETVISSLLVFDAKSGFKLHDLSLSGQLDADIKTINRVIIESKAQLLQTGINYVAVLAVRNAGVPTKYKYQMENIASEVQRRLVAAPEIAVLERSRLGLVLKERELSMQQHKLLTSASLLDFEFSQGTSAEIVNLKLYIMSPDGKILKEKIYENCLTEPDTVIKNIISDLSKYFNKPMTGKVSSAKAEAQRYFNEYRYHSGQQQYTVGVQALEAAIALNNKNIKYQLKLLSVMPWAVSERRSSSKKEYFGGLLSAAQQILKESKAIRQRFPNYSKGITEITTINDWLWSNLKNNYSVLTDAQKQAAIDYSHEMRPFFSQELFRYWKYDLSDGINSRRELQNYEAHLMRNVWRFLYFDDDEFMQAYIINSTKVIKAYNEFSQKHHFVKLHLGFCRGHDFINLYDVLKRHLQKEAILDFIVAAKDSRQVDIKEKGYIVEFARKSALKNNNREYFVMELKKLLPVLAEIHKDKRAPSSRVPNSFRYIVRDYLRHQDAPRGLYNLFEETRQKFILNNSSPQDWETIAIRNKQAKTSEDIAELVIASKEYIGTWRRANSKTNRVDYGEHPARIIREMANKINPFIYLSIKDREICLEALRILNSPLKVRLVKTFFEQYNEFSRNVVEYEGDLYLIGGDKKLMIFKFDLKSEKVDEVYSVENNSRTLNFKYVLDAFFVNDKYFIIGGDGKMLLISRKNGSTTIIKDLPDRYVHGIAVMNDRVYAFTGLKKVVANTLFSCDLKGQERKVHISTRNRVKQNPLEEQSEMRISRLFPDPAKNRLLFVNGGKYPGLWTMNLENGTLKCLLSINNTDNSWVRKIKDQLHIVGGTLETAYFIYDIKKDSSEFICFNFSRNYLKGFGLQAHKPRYITGQRLNIRPPFLAGGKHLWAGRFGGVFVDMEARNGMYCIYGLGWGLGQHCEVSFFPCPDSDDVYAVCARSIFRISPPPAEGKKENEK